MDGAARGAGAVGVEPGQLVESGGGTLHAMDSRERAARRRAEWQGELVSLHESKGPLYTALSLEERLAAMTQLCARAAIAAGYPASPSTSRAEWPGELFELRRG